MIDFLSNNLYTILGGLVCAFIVSYLMVQSIQHSFEFADIDRKKFRLFLRIIGALPFVILLALIALLA